MSDSYWFTPWVQVLAPPAALAIAATWTVGLHHAHKWYKLRTSRRFYEGSVKTLSTALNRPETSDAHKDSIRAQLEEIEQIYTSSIRSEMEVLANNGAPLENPPASPTQTA